MVDRHLMFDSAARAKIDASRQPIGQNDSIGQNGNNNHPATASQPSSQVTPQEQDNEDRRVTTILDAIVGGMDRDKNAETDRLDAYIKQLEIYISENNPEDGDKSQAAENMRKTIAHLTAMAGSLKKIMLDYTPLVESIVKVKEDIVQAMKRTEHEQITPQRPVVNETKTSFHFAEIKNINKEIADDMKHLRDIILNFYNGKLQAEDLTRFAKDENSMNDFTQFKIDVFELSKNTIRIADKAIASGDAAMTHAGKALHDMRNYLNMTLNGLNVNVKGVESSPASYGNIMTAVFTIMTNTMYLLDIVEKGAPPEEKARLEQNRKGIASWIKTLMTHYGDTHNPEKDKLNNILQHLSDGTFIEP